jgi:hypothetical protein
MQLSVRVHENRTLRLLEDLEALDLIEIIEKKEEKPLGRNAGGGKTETTSRKDTLKELLLRGPVFSKKQLADIENTRKAINEWRTE